MKRLALLSTAAILPMLAITSCGDDDNPPASSGGEGAYTQAEIKAFFNDALNYTNWIVNLRNRYDIDTGTLIIPSDTQLIQNMRPMDNESSYAFGILSVSNDGSLGIESITLTVETTFPADNSGIIFTINCEDVRTADNTSGDPIPMKYVLHYDFVPGGEEFNDGFVLNFENSSFTIGNSQEYVFGTATNLTVPQYLLSVTLKMP